MSRWRELKYYEKGTPTKTAMQHRRRHLFTWSPIFERWYAKCGIVASSERFGIKKTNVQKCGHCIKHVGRQ